MMVTIPRPCMQTELEQSQHNHSWWAVSIQANFPVSVNQADLISHLSSDSRTARMASRSEINEQMIEFNAAASWISSSGLSSGDRRMFGPNTGGSNNQTHRERERERERERASEGISVRVKFLVSSSARINTRRTSCNIGWSHLVNTRMLDDLGEEREQTR